MLLLLFLRLQSESWETKKKKRKITDNQQPAVTFFLNENLQKISNTFAGILSTILGKDGFGFEAQLHQTITKNGHAFEHLLWYRIHVMFIIGIRPQSESKHI